jgi:hypothetical protein
MKASLAACRLAPICATTPAEESDLMTLPKGKLVYKSPEELPADMRVMFLRQAERVQKATLLSGMPYAVFQVSESMTNVVRAQQEQAVSHRVPHYAHVCRCMIARRPILRCIPCA